MKIRVPKERLIAGLEEALRMLTIHDGKAFRNGAEINQLSYTQYASMMLETGKPEYEPQAAQLIDLWTPRMCHFTPMIVSRLLLEFGDRLPQRCHEKIKGYLKDLRHEYIDNELDFVGVNDNFPFMSTYAALGYWYLLGDEEMLQTAYRRFGQLERLLKRRGVISEYNSMSYTPLQLYVSAALYKIAPNQRCKEIALNAQRRIWFDFLSHYHPEVGSFTGPFSRHYINPDQGGFPFLQNLLEPAVQVKGYGGEEWFHLTEEFDCPDEAYRLVFERSYPFVVTGTSEYTASTDATPEAARRDMTKEEDHYEYGAGVSGLYAYQTGRYGIGTATNEWHNGVQTTSFYVNYRRVDKPAFRGDARYVYSRYLLNDETVENQRFFDQGRKMAFGRENQALVLYKPKIAAIPTVDSGSLEQYLAAHYKRQEISGHMGVTSAKLLILMPLDGIRPDCVMLGDEVLGNCEGKSESPKSVYIRDGGMYMAFHPLHITDLGRDCAMSVRIRDNWLEIALYNYVGEKRDFAKRHFLHVRNGFLFSAGCVEENGSFEAFLEREAKTVITDRMITSNHARQTYIRQVDAITAQRKLSCEYAPASESIKFIACDDYALEFPKLSITGVDPKAIPYM